jgi:hypothetical protein
MENPSYRSKSHFSGMDGFGKNLAVQETLLLRILWCSQSGDHPGNEFLANFGYILDMKVGKKKKKENPCLFLTIHCCKLS